MPIYAPRVQNVIQKILKDHFSDFEKRYDDHYADKYGKYRIIRIKEAVEKFLEWGDYSKGIARIKCTNPECWYEYFRPFSCKGWYLCPSCNQKSLQLFSEYLSENVLLNLPFTVWMLKGFIQESPKEIEESAMIDGCSTLGALAREVLPTIKAGIAATIILSFVVA